VIIGPREAALRSTINAIRPNILIPDNWQAGKKIRAKIRSGGDPAPCVILEATEEALSVQFDSPVFGPASGQRLVIYDEFDNVIGGATIQVKSNDQAHDL